MSARSPTTPRPSRRVAILGPDADAMVRLRAGLIGALTAAGHRVVCFVGAEPGQHRLRDLEALGANTAVFDHDQTRFRLLADRRTIAALEAAFRDLRPQAVLGFGLEPMQLAAVAGRRAGVPHVLMLASDLGTLATGPPNPRPSHSLGLAQRWLLRTALRAANTLVCYNADQQHLIAAAAGQLPDRLDIVVQPGAGVDLAHFTASPLPPLTPSTGLVFAMVARLDRSKGVLEFCEAARRVRGNAPTARFVLAGPPGRSPDALSASDIAAYADIVDYRGEIDDVRPLLAASHVFVLPSRAEGMSRTLLEALASGRPVIATAIPGCREMVDERVNGVLVPPGDTAGLAAAMESLLRRPDLLSWMARASRLKAEGRFDANAVNADLIRLMHLDGM